MTLRYSGSSTLLALVSTVLISACSSSGSGAGDEEQSLGAAQPGSSTVAQPGSTAVTAQPEDVSGDVQLFGTVSVDQISGGSGLSKGNMEGAFFMATTPVAAADIASTFIPAVDTCVVSRFGIDDGPAPIFDFDFEFASAGEAVIVSSPGGTFATLQSTTDEDSIVYELADEVALPLPVPSGLVVDIPGRDFPEFSMVSIPDVEALSGVSLNADDVTASTEFSWIAGAASESVIEIDASSFDIESLTFSTVACVTVDDGQFVFPDDIQMELGTGFNGNATVSRIATNFIVRGNTVLIVSNSASVR